MLSGRRVGKAGRPSVNRSPCETRTTSETCLGKLGSGVFLFVSGTPGEFSPQAHEEGPCRAPSVERSLLSPADIAR